jgi:hypothetical protein
LANADLVRTSCSATAGDHAHARDRFGEFDEDDLVTLERLILERIQVERGS